MHKEEQGNWKQRRIGTIKRFRIWTSEEDLILRTNPYPKNSKISVEEWVDNLKLLKNS
jgi:hypothetical protein